MEREPQSGCGYLVKAQHALVTNRSARADCFVFTIVVAFKHKRSNALPQLDRFLKQQPIANQFAFEVDMQLRRLCAVTGGPIG